MGVPNKLTLILGSPRQKGTAWLGGEGSKIRHGRVELDNSLDTLFICGGNEPFREELGDRGDRLHGGFNTRDFRNFRFRSYHNPSSPPRLVPERPSTQLNKLEVPPVPLESRRNPFPGTLGPHINQTAFGRARATPRLRDRLIHLPQLPID